MRNSPLDLLAFLARSKAPPGLDERALAAARAVFASPVQQPPLVEQLWASRGLRRGWAFASVVLLAANLYLAAASTAGKGEAPQPQAATSAPTGEEALLADLLPPEIGSQTALAETRQILLEIDRATSGEQEDSGSPEDLGGKA
ncbi:MAG: hypothetical protein V1750_07470 [Acidobacteriota bacterium]